MICIALEGENVENVDAMEQPLQHEEEQNQEQRHTHQLQHCKSMDNMLDELNNHYLEEQGRRIDKKLIML